MRIPLSKKDKGVGTSKNARLDDPIRIAYKSFDELQKTSLKDFNRIQFLDTKRAEIALKFVRWYLLYVFFILVFVPVYNAFVFDLKEPLDIYKLLGQVGTLLGTPLGFVVGYYFKDDKDRGDN